MIMSCRILIMMTYIAKMGCQRLERSRTRPRPPSVPGSSSKTTGIFDMYHGKPVFSQLMNFTPWHTIRRCIDRYRGYLQGPIVSIHPAVPLHGIGTIDLPRKSTRHRNLPSGTVRQTQSHGHTTRCVPQHPGQRKSKSRLANLFGLHATTD